MISWRERIMDCVRLPAEMIAPTQPINVVIVNRPYNAGRGFLNAPEAVTTMQARALLLPHALWQHVAAAGTRCR